MSMILTSLSGNGIVSIADRAMVYCDNGEQASEETKVFEVPAKKLLLNACGDISSDESNFEERIKLFVAQDRTASIREFAQSLFQHMKDRDNSVERIVIQCAALEQREAGSVPVFFHISSANPAQRVGDRYSRKESGYGILWDFYPQSVDISRVRKSRAVFCNGYANTRNLLLQTKLRDYPLFDTLAEEREHLQKIFSESAEECGTVEGGPMIVSSDCDYFEIEWA